MALALLQVSSYSYSGIGIGDNAGPRLNKGLVIFHHDRADVNAQSMLPENPK